MLKFVGTIFGLAVAAVAVRRVIQAKQATHSATLQREGGAEKAKAKAKQTLENAKENLEGMAEVAKDKVREKSVV